jgi:hypothetical protein
MTAHSRRLLGATLLVAGLLAPPGLAPRPAAAADEPDLTGTWKLATLQIVEADLLTFDVKQTDRKLSAFIAEPAQLRDNAVQTVERNGETLRLAFSINGNAFSFTGKAAKGNKYLGALNVPNGIVPAQLAKTDDKILTQPRPPQELFVAMNAVEAAKEPKAKADKLAEILHKSPGDAKYSPLYAELVRYASLAEEPVETVRKYVDEWVQGAEPYGPEWSQHVRAQALKALTDKKPYADLALKLAEQTEQGFTDATSLEVKADVVHALAAAAKLAGKADVAARADERAKKLEAELDEEYHKKVPPFKPAVSEGRKGKAGDRVVLLELFTGAQCPPCVAADVAFDALNESYKPSELVTLQYHLHIPGPDPLTNPSTSARAEYYTDLRGTPAAYFNGRQLQGGGGGMPQSKAKYDEYRENVETALDQKKRATIDLHVERTGDDVKITASARANAGDGQEKTDKSGDSGAKDGVKLRIALAEEEIKYVGGNKLRFHHHVVRAMPGGPAGKSLSGGQAKLELTVNLADLRKELDGYLNKFVSENGSFPSPRPPIALRKLTVVAFVQDDGTKAVLHAVSAPVSDGNADGKSE